MARNDLDKVDMSVELVQACGICIPSLLPKCLLPMMGGIHISIACL